MSNLVDWLLELMRGLRLSPQQESLQQEVLFARTHTSAWAHSNAARNNPDAVHRHTRIIVRDGRR